MLEGGKNGDQSDKNQTRDRYSPVHKEAAVCCVPNAGKIVASYVEHMWMQHDNAIYATLLGPNELNTSIKSEPITIKEMTNYPFDNPITFKIEIKKSTRFDLFIKRPEGIEDITLNMPFENKDGYLHINRLWKNGDILQFRMNPKVLQRQTIQGEQYFMYGPVVLAHAIDGKQHVTKNYSVAGLKEMTYTPLSKSIYLYSGMPVTKLKASKSLRFITQMKDSKTGTSVPLELVPMGTTILRQTTFKNAN